MFGAHKRCRHRASSLPVLPTLAAGSLTRWLAGGALSGAQSQDVLAELCERMVAGGIPLWRVAVFVTFNGGS